MSCNCPCKANVAALTVRVEALELALQDAHQAVVASVARGAVKAAREKRQDVPATPEATPTTPSAGAEAEGASSQGPFVVMVRRPGGEWQSVKGLNPWHWTYESAEETFWKAKNAMPETHQVAVFRAERGSAHQGRGLVIHMGPMNGRLAVVETFEVRPVDPAGGDPSLGHIVRPDGWDTPPAPPREVESSPPVNWHPGGRGVSAPLILVLEDHEATRSALLRSLSCRGYDVDTEWTLAGFRDTFAQRPYSLVVTDNQVPPESGRLPQPSAVEVVDLCVRRGVPAVVHSGSDLRGAWSGLKGVRFVSKGEAPSVLLGVIEELLGGAE